MTLWRERVYRKRERDRKEAVFVFVDVGAESEKRRKKINNRERERGERVNTFSREFMDSFSLTSSFSCFSLGREKEILV